MNPVMVTSTEGWVEVLRKRRKDLGLTHLAIDDEVGIADGHTSKIEAPDKPYGKRPFNMTFVADYLLQRLGLCMVIMDRDEAVKLCERSSEFRSSSRERLQDRSQLTKRVGWVVRHQSTTFRPSGTD